VLAALADGGVIILLYLISKKNWPSLLYSLMVLPIQLSHFFAVDPFLNFFLVLSFYAAYYWSPFLVGLFMGMALSCKITAVLFLPIIGLVFLKRFNKFKDILRAMSYLLLATALSARIFNPYSFVSFFWPNPRFIENIKSLKGSENPDTWFPPAVQWINTKPIIFPVKNIFFWGLGVPMGLVTILGIVNAILNLFQNLKVKELIKNNKLPIITWIFFLLIFQGIQFSKTMRYFLPIYPFLALVGGCWLSKQSKKIKTIIVPNLFIYPLMFMAIYSQPHTRVKASKWIYENISPGSTITCDHWDDCLPLSIGKNNHTLYKQETLKLYDRETQVKMKNL
jgi:4-amino-4-deoxy-L-arabinose transferase-like glycosyltransferase